VSQEFACGGGRLLLHVTAPGLLYSVQSKGGAYKASGVAFCYSFQEVLTALLVEQNGGLESAEDFFFQDEPSFGVLADRLSVLEGFQYILFEIDLRDLHSVAEEDLQAVIPRRLQRAMKEEAGPSIYALIRMLHAGFTLPLVSRDGMYTLPFHAGLPGGVPSPLPPEIQTHALENGSTLVLHAQPAKGITLRELHQQLAEGQVVPDLFVVRIGFDL